MIVVLALALAEAVASQAVEFGWVHGVFRIVLDGVDGEADVGAFRNVQAVRKGMRGREEPFQPEDGWWGNPLRLAQHAVKLLEALVGCLVPAVLINRYDLGSQFVKVFGVGDEVVQNVHHTEERGVHRGKGQEHFQVR